MTVTGGDKLNAALSRIAQNLAKASTVRVGFMEGATNTEGESIPMIAAINEYGAPSRGQPPRPFFRSMIEEYSPEWPALIEHFLKQTDYDAEKTLAAVGDIIAEQLRQSIIDFTSPALAASTIKRKGSDKPLIERGDMLQAVIREVE